MWQPQLPAQTIWTAHRIVWPAGSPSPSSSSFWLPNWSSHCLMRLTARPLLPRFYAEHRTFIIALQLLGVIDALLLGGYAWRLGSVDRFVAGAGLLTAFRALAPTMITLILAIVADPAHTKTAARWNMLEPRGDDILFVGIVVFASTVAVRLGRNNPALGILAFLVAVACLLRLILKAAGKNRGALEAVGPLLFVVLIATMAVLSFRGVLRAVPDDFVDHSKSPSHNA